MVKHIFTLLTALFILHGSCSAELPDTNNEFKSGIELYKQSRYKQSAQKFKQALKSGMESGAIYFNLGNCYFKMGKLGKARASYEKAKYFLPRDHDLNGNLAYLATKLEDKVELPKKNIFLRIYLLPSDFFTRNELALFVLVSFIIIILLWLTLILRIPFRRIIIGKAIVFLIIFGWLSSVLCVKIGTENKPDFGVVMIKEAPVRWGNTDDDKVAFYLHEGTKVLIRQQRGNWFLVTIGNDKTGWIKNRFLEVL